MSRTERSAQVLLELLRAIDESARLDLNYSRHGIATYEVRIYGAHHGFVHIGPNGELQEWI